MATFTKLASGRYRIRIRRVGYALVSATKPSLAEAKVWARQTEAEMDRGVYKASTAAKTLTLADLLDRYRDEVAPTLLGRKQVECMLRWIVAKPIARRRLNGLTSTDVAQYRDRRLRDGYNPGTVHRELATIRTILNHAKREWNIAAADPFTVGVMPPLPPHRERRASEDEERRLLAAASPDLRDAIVVLIETGLRAGELVDLRWERIDWNRRTARVSTYKSGKRGIAKTRSIPLSNRAMATLQPIRQASGPVVAFGSVSALSHAFQRLARRLQIDDLRLHDLRHTCLSRLAEKGWSAAELMALSGHSSLDMLSRYVHVSAEHLLAKMDRDE